jgi:hypothetical protein
MVCKREKHTLREEGPYTAHEQREFGHNWLFAERTATGFQLISQKEKKSQHPLISGSLQHTPPGSRVSETTERPINGTFKQSL